MFLIIETIFFAFLTIATELRTNESNKKLFLTSNICIFRSFIVIWCWYLVYRYATIALVLFGKKETSKKPEKCWVFENLYSRYMEYFEKAAYLSIVSLFIMQGE